MSTELLCRVALVQAAPVWGQAACHGHADISMARVLTRAHTAHQPQHTQRTC